MNEFMMSGDSTNTANYVALTVTRHNPARSSYFLQDLNFYSADSGELITSDSTPNPSSNTDACVNQVAISQSSALACSIFFCPSNYSNLRLYDLTLGTKIYEASRNDSFSVAMKKDGSQICTGERGRFQFYDSSPDGLIPSTTINVSGASDLIYDISYSDNEDSIFACDGGGRLLKIDAVNRILSKVVPSGESLSGTISVYGDAVVFTTNQRVIFYDENLIETNRLIIQGLPISTTLGRQASASVSREGVLVLSSDSNRGFASASVNLAGLSIPDRQMNNFFITPNSRFGSMLLYAASEINSGALVASGNPYLSTTSTATPAARLAYYADDKNEFFSGPPLWDVAVSGAIRKLSF